MLQPAMSNDIVLKEAEIFDNMTGRIEVPSSAITITLADNDEVCFIIDTNNDLLPCGLLEEAYLQLLHIIHSDAKEAAKYFKDVREDLGNDFEHAVFIGWINTQFKKYAPKSLFLIIRQGVIAGVSFIRTIPLKYVLQEVVKHKSIKQYSIGNYEQIFILDDDWAFIYSDVAKFPPTFYKKAIVKDGKIENFEKVHPYSFNKLAKLKVKDFIKDTFTRKVVKI